MILPCSHRTCGSFLLAVARCRRLARRSVGGHVVEAVVGRVFRLAEERLGGLGVTLGVVDVLGAELLRVEVEAGEVSGVHLTVVFDHEADLRH